MKQMAVLGLGRFGASVARSLVQHGVEVMGVDSDPEKVADIAPDITHAVQADVMDVDALILSACEILTGDSQYQGCGDQLSDHHDAEGSAASALWSLRPGRRPCEDIGKDRRR